MYSPQCITFLHFLEASTSLWSLRHLGYGYSPSSFAYVLYDPGMAFTACFDISNLNSIVYSITTSSTSNTLLFSHTGAQKLLRLTFSLLGDTWNLPHCIFV